MPQFLCVLTYTYLYVNLHLDFIDTVENYTMNTHLTEFEMGKEFRARMMPWIYVSCGMLIIGITAQYALSMSVIVSYGVGALAILTLLFFNIYHKKSLRLRAQVTALETRIKKRINQLPDADVRRFGFMNRFLELSPKLSERSPKRLAKARDKLGGFLWGCNRVHQQRHYLVKEIRRIRTTALILVRGIDDFICEKVREEVGDTWSSLSQEEQSYYITDESPSLFSRGGRPLDEALAFFSDSDEFVEIRPHSSPTARLQAICKDHQKYLKVLSQAAHNIYYYGEI